MNEPAAIQSQQIKWMEVILVWLGILIPLRFIPVIYQNLQFSRSTPELLINSFGGLLILVLSLGLLLKFQSIPLWILKTSISHSELSRRDSELSGWLTIGIFTFGLLFLASTILLMLSLLGSQLSIWFNPRGEALGMTEGKIAFSMTISALNHLPPLIVALSLTLFAQPLARWTISLQER